MPVNCLFSLFKFSFYSLSLSLTCKNHHSYTIYTCCHIMSYPPVPAPDFICTCVFMSNKSDSDSDLQFRALKTGNNLTRFLYPTSSWTLNKKFTFTFNYRFNYLTVYKVIQSFSCLLLLNFSQYLPLHCTCNICSICTYTAKSVTPSLCVLYCQIVLSECILHFM